METNKDLSPDDEPCSIEEVPQRYVSVKDWLPSEQPRERLISKGPAALTDAELLAILLRTGAKNLSVVDVARRLMEKFGTLSDLSARDYKEYMNIHGMGEVKAVTISAAFELGRRIQADTFNIERSLRSPHDVANHFIPLLRHKKVESFYAVLLNNANQVIRYDEISRGTINASIVHPREVFKKAVIESASSILVLHNHPSGNTEPSPQDLQITKQLVEAGKILGIHVLDHFIIAGDTFTSFKDRGLM